MERTNEQIYNDLLEFFNNALADLGVNNISILPDSTASLNNVGLVSSMLVTIFVETEVLIFKALDILARKFNTNTFSTAIATYSVQFSGGYFQNGKYSLKFVLYVQ